MNKAIIVGEFNSLTIINRTRTQKNLQYIGDGRRNQPCPFLIEFLLTLHQAAMYSLSVHGIFIKRVHKLSHKNDKNINNLKLC
jgi:hypothetical protein